MKKAKGSLGTVVGVGHVETIFYQHKKERDAQILYMLRVSVQAHDQLQEIKKTQYITCALTLTQQEHACIMAAQAFDKDISLS